MKLSELWRLYEAGIFLEGVECPMNVLILIFMFLVVTGLISIDGSLKRKLKNDKILMEKINELIERNK
ncbi:hypothetical protein BCM02_10794 [Paenibacillus methanolicus]|uniref:Uncharacterized protein n=1 Tax=Paenibacillus methanolicus TaxID=582686 RepID=A0A5S5C454_9BACL|nr:hypothetical protein BCM02_10794 [Paenibacillus methanolicus]